MLVPFSRRPREETINTAIQVWLKSEMDHSQSIRTHDTYLHYITSFRAKLKSAGYDLDGLPVLRVATKEDKAQTLAILSLAAQGWASTSLRKATISAATYNQRLSVLSSFYAFARKRQLLIMDNPIDMLDRRDIQEYASAQPLSREKVEQTLRSIDRTVWAGRRDYALLLVFFSTGRRASEVLSLQWKHVEMLPEEGTAILHFEHCKGGKGMYDKLDPRVWRALRDYLQSVVARDLSNIPGEQYLWLSFSMKNFKQPLTQRGLADIFKVHFKTMKVHSTRHTFAHQMQETGASVTDIQHRLGHSNVATTGRYLQQLKSAVNIHVSALLDSLGIDDE